MRYLSPRLSLLLASLAFTTDLPLHFRMTLFYDGFSGSAFTYSVDGDANGDGYLNDAIYVPLNAAPGGDIELVVENEQGDMVPAPASEYAELNHFIEEEGCLREQRGHLLQRNSCRNPWSASTDARFSRVFPAAHNRSLELSLDVFNFLHLVNPDWGLVHGVDSPQLLQLAGYDVTAGRGIYRRLPRTTRAVINGSQWRMQVGARVTF